MKTSIARKKSLDPAQEHLREEKSQWNGEVSKFIAELIALKRAINGKEIPELGIPKSNIKDPIPSQVESLVSEISGQCGTLLSHVKQIINEQQNYSEHRRKPHKEASLDKEASWFGSRLKSHITLLKLDKMQRKYRLQMIHSCADLIEEFKVFEDELLESNKIPMAFTKLNSILVSYRGTLLDEFHNLVELFPEKPAEPAAPTDEKKKSEQAPEPPPAEETDPQLAKLLQFYKMVSSNSERFSTYLNKLRAAGGLEKAEQVKITELINKFKRIIMELHFLKSNNDPKFHDDLKVLFIVYKEIFDLLTLHSDKMSTLFPGWNITHLNYKENIKEASNAVGRWVKTQLLKLKTDNSSYMTLRIVLLSKQVREQLDDLLDLLEDNKSHLDQISSKLSDINNSIIEMIDKMLLMGKKYSLEIRRTPRSKYNYLREISERDNRDFQETSRHLKGIEF